MFHTEQQMHVIWHNGIMIYKNTVINAAGFFNIFLDDFSENRKADLRRDEGIPPYKYRSEQLFSVLGAKCNN